MQRKKGGLPRHPDYVQRQTRVAELRANGVTFEMIARDMHLSKSRVQQIFNQHHVEQRAAPKPLRATSDADICVYRREKARRIARTARLIAEAQSEFARMMTALAPERRGNRLPGRRASPTPGVAS